MAAADENLDEFAIIRELFQPLAGDGSYDLIDDVARLAATSSIVTKDLLVGGCHFLPDDPAGEIARKALRVNISDIVCKGARPVNYVLGIVLPRQISRHWLEAFAAGLREDQEHFGLTLLGGDTTRQVEPSAPLVLSVTMFGEPLSERAPVLRSGAGIGDRVFVTGTIGDGGLGLLARQQRLDLPRADQDFVEQRYLRPEPRVSAATVIAKYASAAMDVSDGLFADAGHISTASGVDVVIAMADVPLSDAARNWLAHEADLDEARQKLLSAGDDYEILCTVPASEANKFAKRCQDIGVPVTAIGECESATSGGKVRVLNSDGREVRLSRHGFNHFAG